MATSNTSKDLHILIVDDDQLVRDFAVHTIEYGTNRKVVTFDSGFQAWKYIQNQPHYVDIIIADANIPDMNGMELLGQVKENYPDKTFVITASNPDFEKTAYQLGAAAFLSKPFDVDDLFAILQQFVYGFNTPEEVKLTQLPGNAKAEKATDD